MTQSDRIKKIQLATATINARVPDHRVPTRGEWELMSRLILQLAGPSRPDITLAVDNVVPLRG